MVLSAPLEPWERRARLAAAEPKEQPEVSEQTAQRERLAQLEVAVPTEEQPAHWALRVLAARLVRPAPGVHWVLLEQLVVSVPRECLAQLELAVPKERPAHWAQRVPEVRWGPPVHQGRKEPLEQPEVSERTAQRERLA